MKTIPDIIASVARITGADTAEILHPTRGLEHAAKARQMVYLLAREAGHNFIMIGRAVGRCRTTVSKGIADFEKTLTPHDRYTDLMSVARRDLGLEEPGEAQRRPVPDDLLLRLVA